MAQRQSLRGTTLDEAIDALLAQMISLGLERAPISRPEVQRRLGLTSRATLVGERGRRIEAARVAQLQESGKDPDHERRRRSLEERIALLQAENAALIKQRDRLYEALSVISHNCLVRGLDVEEVLAPLRRR
ncbi:hypothetical protein [Pseudomonas aeruginosa]|uniref:hypothetical protein n=1 Tax=Pseudomonas aeruginosa TaxID=287 RepID=UPI0008035118|nr:hypothetical protein [Pseudomonas aeruginosa]MBG5868241.1 hypothetical protein [Pseudomonas aeruginosa]MBH4330053.1 hypothetical protein [Pseudomonas aeruginosa]MDG4473485.1 hypothetical protein [Pseudomonas aeruginosa]OBY19922.1 hypothetical protein A8O37_28515 [Pseudomonas aeruginosa]RQG48314.1 hypothetical protein IPC203_31635 [Pseudomonas aeruginosa]